MDESEIMQTAGEQEGGFLDGWDETSSAGGETEEGGDQAVQAEEMEASDTGADEASQDGGGGGNGGEDQTAEAQQPLRTWTLNHLGQTVTAGEADMVALAQKGLDYDRIRSAYEESRPVMDMFRDFAKRADMPVEAYLAHIRAQAKQSEGMSEQEARRAVELENREAVVAAREEAERQQQFAAQQEAARRQTTELRRQADIREFMEIFSDAAKDPRSIPKEVWDEVRGGRSLVAAYARYHAAQAQTAQEAERQNARNAARSAGSMRSAGAGTGAKDPFLEGWDE